MSGAATPRTASARRLFLDGHGLNHISRSEEIGVGSDFAAPGKPNWHQENAVRTMFQNSVLESIIF
jgi:hypothetical protein